MARQSNIATSCWIVFIVWLSILLTGCTATRFLREGESFYEGAEIKLNPQGKISGKNKLKKHLEPLIIPRPNKKFLGMRTGVWFYYIAGTPEKKKGLRNFIKTKLGKTPVLLRDVEPDQTAQILETELNNEGYFKSDVTFDIKTKHKTSKVIYTAMLEPPYVIRNINYIFFDSLHAAITDEIKKTSLLKEKQRYSLQRLQAEQERIEEVAENAGFFYFDDRYLLFKADSTVGNRMVDLDLTIEPGIPKRATQIYRLSEITVVPNHTLTDDSTSVTSDTLMVDGYRYVDHVHNFRPEIITRVINLRPDSIYRRVNHEYTLSHLMGLNTFKFVNIKYRRDREDSTSLRAFIYLTPLLKKSFRIQMQGVSKSNNFLGPGLEFSFTNRNFLQGAELFQLKLFGSYEMQVRKKQLNPLSMMEVGGEVSLSVPRFIAPIRIRHTSAKYLPHTQFKVGYSLQQRSQYFRLNSFNTSAGYIWRETKLKTHELFPIDITFVQESNTSVEFDKIREINPVLRNSFQNQFILGSRYSYTINTQLSDDVEQKYNLKKFKRANFYFNGQVDLSGNLAHAIQSLQPAAEDKSASINPTYSQYVRTQLDFRYYYQINKGSKLATRLLTGVGYAFGNSETLPYIKQFSSGGSGSLRAFPARSVGPGTYNFLAADTVFFIDQRGDIKLEGSVEYRFDIIKTLKGAFFVDAGNIWLAREDPQRVGGKFQSDKFLKELAVGTGFGLRFDFNFFVLRFDLAFPLRKPYEIGNDKWVVNDIDFSSPAWRRQNLILNIAIGYPF